MENSNSADLPMLRVESLTKRYGAATVLDGLSLSVNRGTVVAVLGENGSGKSTLLRIAATLTKPTSGAVSIMETDAVSNAAEARRFIGAVMHSPMLYSDLTVRENLSLFATLCQLDEAERIVDEVASRLRLIPRLDERVRKLSHGYRKRVSIARSILHSPALLLLDEPETGIDAASLDDLNDIIAEWRRSNRAVLIATHNPDLVANSADIIYRISDGRLETAA